MKPVPVVLLSILLALATPWLQADSSQVVTNHLGMSFVKVDNLWVSIYETRVQDFAAFVEATGYKAVDERGLWMRRHDKWERVGESWRKLEFEQTPDHPVCGVNFGDAVAFCEWLTETEHASGQLPRDEEYRLPTDLEWSAMIGLHDETGEWPKDRDEKIKDRYIWGTDWPPTTKVGNLAGEETGFGTVIDGYNDGVVWTAPVGSFPPNKVGIYDLAGNVNEWIGDWYDESRVYRLVRGGSFMNGFMGRYLASERLLMAGRLRVVHIGFRVVRDRERSHH